jgi:hypothetical protein
MGRLGRERDLLGELAASLELAVAGQRPEREAAVAALDPGEGKVADVDQQARLGEAEAHHRDEALATGQRPRLDAGARQRLDRLGDRLRAGVLERARIHLRRPSPRRRRCRGR